MKIGKGITFYICFGNWAGFHLSLDRKADRGWQLILGWVSLAIVFYDIEVVLGLMADKIKANTP